VAIVNEKCVVTIDIKGSRKLNPAERENVHFSIFKVIDKIKGEFPSNIIAAGMTAGDEFQLVVNQPEFSIEVYRFVNGQIPAECYFGVGFGEITDFGTVAPSEMYGEAFYRSRNAIELAKSKRRGEICFKLGDELLDQELNTIFELIVFIKSKQTKRQKEITNFLNSHRYSQKDVALNFSVSEQAISKIRKNSACDIIYNAEFLAETLLKRRLSKKCE
jgi:hypothetical protein